jgi:hypothetical protein
MGVLLEYEMEAVSVVKNPHRVLLLILFFVLLWLVAQTIPFQRPSIYKNTMSAWVMGPDRGKNMSPLCSPAPAIRAADLKATRSR